MTLSPVEFEHVLQLNHAFLAPSARSYSRLGRGDKSQNLRRGLCPQWGMGTRQSSGARAFPTRKAHRFLFHDKTEPRGPKSMAMIHAAWRLIRPMLPAFLDPGRKVRLLLETAQRLASAESPDPRLSVRSADPTPLISLVAPVYNTKTAYLDELLASFRSQEIDNRTTGLFELVLSDDGSTSLPTREWLDRHAGEPRLKVVRNSENGGIAAATNSGIRAAEGEWVAFIDHDDALAPFALERIAVTLLERPEIELLYTDEVITNSRLDPEGYFLKPAWDEILLSGVNYINHLSVYRRSRLGALGNLRPDFDGSQDYDLLLRYTRDLDRSKILHLPYPAYLWRRDGTSYSAQFMAKATRRARQALQERYHAAGRTMNVQPALDPNLHRVDWAGARHEWPLVSVVIPSRNAKALIAQVIDGLRNKTDYPRLEIIIVDNGSDDPEVLDLYKAWTRDLPQFHAEIRTEPFNFSRAVNRGCERARGDVFLLLNNDVEMQHPDWLKEMVSCLDYPNTGIVGAKLLYPNRTIQHVGVIAGLGGLAGHWFIGENRDLAGPMGRLQVRQSMSVVTGACFLMSRQCWQDVGPFDEERFAIAYNDVDYCLRALEKGFRVIWTPFAELVHHESASRGSDETPANIERFKREQANLRDRHRTDILDDRAFNPWWTKGQSRPEIRVLPALPAAR
ncbi:MAG: glycosyltransferase [Methylobacterium sp.]|nr:MAG: glycosyltransferase [Methylobacterium sp.]